MDQEPFNTAEKNNNGQKEMQSSDTDDIPLAHLGINIRKGRVSRALCH